MNFLLKVVLPLIIAIVIGSVISSVIMDRVSNPETSYLPALGFIPSFIGIILYFMYQSKKNN